MFGALLGYLPQIKSEKNLHTPLHCDASAKRYALQATSAGITKKIN